MGLTIKAFAVTHPGRVRPNNEDSYLLFEEYKGSKSMDWDGLVKERGELYIVADGLGGHAAGEVASKTASLAFADSYYSSEMDTSADDPLKRLLFESMVAAHKAVIEKVEKDPKKYRGMGTTLTAGVVLGDALFISHVGDSRFYILRGGELEQITKDHTYIQSFVDAGKITKEEANKAPGKHVLTKAVGVQRDDVNGAPAPDLYEHDLRHGDRLLICSDGLTDMLSDGEIAAIMADAADIEACANKLLEDALKAGGKDNITVLIMYVRES